MIKIVCDTNILISAYVFPGGTTDEILSLAGLGELDLYLSPDIISEFKNVLLRKFKYSAEECDIFIGRVLEIATLVYPSERLAIVKRVDADNRVLECAVASEADYLVTGDKQDLLPLKSIGQCKIITPREFLNKIS
jgi:putative PIN family toxin of toxin-antitoxin system